MSNVIDFLERMGQDAQLRYAKSIDIEQAMARAEIDPGVQAAILGADQSLLEALLGATTNVCCMVHPADDDADEDDEDLDDDDDDEDEDEDDDGEDAELKSQRAVANCAASAR